MRSPLLVLAGCFALGILAVRPGAGAFAEIITGVSFLLGAAGACLALGLVLLRAGRPGASSLLLLMGFTAAGAVASILFEVRQPLNHVRYLGTSGMDLSEPLALEGVVASAPVHTRYGIQFDWEVRRIKHAGLAAGNGWRPWTGIIRTRLEASGNGAWSSINALALRTGDSIRAAVLVQKPWVYRNPGSFDYRHWMESTEDVFWLGTIKNPRLVEKLAGNDRLWISKLLENVRRRLDWSIDTLYPPWSGEARDGAVLKAVLLGERTSLDSDTIDNFRKTGLYHLLVIAGLHVGLLALIASFILRRTSLGQTWSVALLLSFLLVYALLVEQRASTLRALLMIFAYLAARLLYREHGAMNAIGMAALALLLYRPAWLSETGFDLSFSAALLIAGLAVPILMLTTEPYRFATRRLTLENLDITFVPKLAQFRLDIRSLLEGLQSRLQIANRHPAIAEWVVASPIRLALWTGNMFLFSAILQIGLLLPMAVTFHRVSISGIGLNALAIPVMVVLLSTAIPTVLLGAVAPSLAVWPAKAVHLVMNGLFALTDLPSLPAWLSFRVAEPPAWVGWGFVISLVLAALALGGKRRVFWICIAGQLVFAALLSIHPFAPRIPSGLVEVTSLDCGGGDAIFVVLPDQTTVLMDACGRSGAGGHDSGRRWDPGENIVSPYLWSRGIERIDVLALTDSRDGHIDGLGSIVRNFSIGEFWHGNQSVTDSSRDLLEEINRRGIKTREVAAGDRFERGSTLVSVLWPPQSTGGQAPTIPQPQDNSLVLRIESGKASVLVSGGITETVAHGLMLSGSVIESATLGIALDDSRPPSASGFLQRVSPLVAVLTKAARFRLKPTTASALDALRVAGVQVYGTDVHGAVTVEMGKDSTSVHAFRASLAD